LCTAAPITGDTDREDEGRLAKPVKRHEVGIGHKKRQAVEADFLTRIGQIETRPARWSLSSSRRECRQERNISRAIDR